PPRLTSSAELAALFAQRDSDVTVIDVRGDYTQYLESHIPRAVYLHVEELRAADRGVPNKLLGLVSYTALFSRLGLKPDRPIVIYSAGETRDIDATYLAWILEGLAHPSVYVLDGECGKSSHVYFALHNLLGYPRVRVYDGSFTEWAERLELPVKTGEDP